MSILIVNAVEWGPQYDRFDIDRDVGRWITDAIVKGDLEFLHWKIREEENPPEGHFGAVILSGSEKSTYDDEPWIGRLSAKIRSWAEDDLPMLGICFGHQIVASSLGGRVVENPRGWEIGTREIELTGEGRTDPLFDGLPPRFKVMESHQDEVVEPPPGSRRLAGNGQSPVQSLAIGDRIRTVQFHPEYTTDHMRMLIESRRAMLEETGVNGDAALAGIESTALGRRVLENFIEFFVC